MSLLPGEVVQAYRRRVFRWLPGQQLRDAAQAAAFVNDCGFVYFWPITGVLLPSLWGAVAGDRPVADQHDDPGHVTWDWKDAALGGEVWYYAKVLRRRATMIAFDIVPYFYALSENYGAPESDYLTQYEQGRLTQEARQVYEALLEEGPLDTIALRRAARLSSAQAESRFERALADLQADFKIVPIGVRDIGAWHYAFAYDIVPRRYPAIPEQGRWIGEAEARRCLLERYARLVGALQPAMAVKLFGWKAALVEQTLESLAAADKLFFPGRIEGQAGDWYFHPALLNSMG